MYVWEEKVWQYQQYVHVWSVCECASIITPALTSTEYKLTGGCRMVLRNVLILWNVKVVKRWVEDFVL